MKNYRWEILSLKEEIEDGLAAVKESIEIIEGTILVKKEAEEKLLCDPSLHSKELKVIDSLGVQLQKSLSDSKIVFYHLNNTLHRLNEVEQIAGNEKKRLAIDAFKDIENRVLAIHKGINEMLIPAIKNKNDNEYKLVECIQKIYRNLFED